jgi:hypothetical protein
MNSVSARRNQRVARRNAVTQARENQVVPLLKQISAFNSQQIRYELPDVPDLEPQTIRRNKVYSFVEHAQEVAILTSSTVPTTNTFSWTLNSSNNSTSYQALFDQWRIAYVSLVFTMDQISTGEATSCYTVIDYDDSNAFVAATDAQQYGTCMIAPIGTGAVFERRLQPRVAQAVYSGAFTSFALAPLGTWIDVASPSTIHYGVKMFVGTTTSPSHIRVNAKIHYQFRNNR